MSHVIKITTNIKSPDGQPYTLDLGKNTLLVGPNEAGKSAIAESVELARTGSACGLLYRVNPIKDGSMLSALIPPQEDSAHIKATLASGEECEWQLERGRRPVRTGPNGVSLSVSEIRSILTGNEETKAKFFWRHACKPKEVEFIRRWLPEDLHPVLDLVVPKDEKEVDLVDLFERVGKAQKDQRSAAKAGRIALGSLGSLQEVSEDEVDGLWETMGRAQGKALIRQLYVLYKEFPGMHSKNTIDALVEYLGGEDAVRRIPEVTDVRTQLEAAILGRRLLKVATIAKSGETNAEVRVQNLKLLRAHIMKVIQEDLSLMTKPFVDKVSGFLPKGERFAFSYDEGKLILGLRRGMTDALLGTIHTALSGSSEARLTAAIAAALAEDETSLIVVDDRMWDGSTLAKTLSVLEKAPCQVIVMTTLKPRGKKRPAWTYIEVSRKEGEPLEVRCD